MSNLELNRGIINIGRNTPIAPQTQIKKGQGQNVDFKSILEQTLQTKQEIVFSKHAQQRVAERNIDVSGNVLQNLNNAILQARAKGVKDALILNGDTAFIVSTTKNIVVTALKGNEMKENVFTNIDGTVII